MLAQRAHTRIYCSLAVPACSVRPGRLYSADTAASFARWQVRSLQQGLRASEQLQRHPWSGLSSHRRLVDVRIRVLRTYSLAHAEALQVPAALDRERLGPLHIVRAPSIQYKKGFLYIL